MKISRLFVSNYKNLMDCEIKPSGLHALTGCNGSGKSNFLEIPQFISKFLSGSDKSREVLLERGISPLSGYWLPMIKNKKQAKPLQIEVDSNLFVNDQEWEVSYKLHFTTPKFVKPYKYDDDGVVVDTESIYLKAVGKSGPRKMILQRGVDGKTIVNLENSKRKKIDFKTKVGMSAIQTLEIRMADDFSDYFPVLSAFYNALIAIDVIKFNPSELIRLANDSSIFSRSPGSVIETFPLFKQIQGIKEREEDWMDYLYWLKRLCDIDSIDPDTYKDEEAASENNPERYYIYIKRQNQLLFPEELSTGCAMLLAIVTSLFSFLKNSGAVFVEEPETYLHPKAIVDLLILLRSFSENNTIVFTTHSPVTLNSLKTSEVTLMAQKDNGFVSAKSVSEIKEAVDALGRGYISFGDLLQSNFTTED